MNKNSERKAMRILMWINILLFVLVMATTLDGELSNTQFFLGFVSVCMAMFCKWQVKKSYKRKITISYKKIDMIHGLKREDVDVTFDERKVHLN